jgi:hypothetical protein
MTIGALKSALAGVFTLLLLTAAGVWKVQEWRYGTRLAVQARLHGDTLNELTLASAAQQRNEQDKRLALEQRLSTSDQIHHKELTDAQINQARLRDRLATSDLRLSVLLAEEPAGGRSMSAATGAVGLDHGAVRARLDPTHAQRIIGITSGGDQGLIALAGCQAYIRELVK